MGRSHRAVIVCWGRDGDMSMQIFIDVCETSTGRQVVSVDKLPPFRAAREGPYLFCTKLQRLIVWQEMYEAMGWPREWVGRCQHHFRDDKSAGVLYHAIGNSIHVQLMEVIQ